MSLPSIAIFSLDGKEVFRSFCNCGWFFEESSVPTYVLDSLKDYMREKGIEKYSDVPSWNTVLVYGKTYTREWLYNQVDKK